MSRPWRPLGAQSGYGRRPEPGVLMANDHAVWKVVDVQDDPLIDDADRDLWISDGMPDLDTWWRGKPFTVRVQWVGGRPYRGKRDDKTAVIRSRPSKDRIAWDYYPTGRWPQCSCCGEPMPCRAELQDRAVEKAEERMTAVERRMPGCCWACEEVITHRQRRVTYPGINLDHPTGPMVMFHLRNACIRDAMEYEARWLGAGVGRERVLTYPKCPGTLVVHRDETTECHGGEDTCVGHLTHDHGSITACFAQSAGCGRECPREGHRGARVPRRPMRDSEHLS